MSGVLIMAEAKKSEVKGDIFDVAKPGTSAPSSSAKPIIVTNRPVLQDPMMVADDNKPEAANPTPVVSPSTKKKIEPLHPAADTALEMKTEPQPAPASAAEPNTNETVTPTPKANIDLNTEPSESETTAGDKKKPETDEALQKKAAERAAELETLTESRKYYLPINQIEKRKNKRYAILGACFIVLLGVAWADVALDAGLITIPGITAPTHLFK